MRKVQLKTLLLLKTIIIIIAGAIYVLANISGAQYSEEEFYDLLNAKALELASIEFENDSLVHLKDSLVNERDYILDISSFDVLSGASVKSKLPVKYLQEVKDKGYTGFQIGSIFYYGIRYVKEDSVFAVIVGAENYYEYRRFAYIKRGVAAVTFLSIIFSLFISFYLSRFIFVPLLRITGRVKQISTENLHLRLELQGNNDEMDVLADTFNDMLNRIESSFEIQNNFVSNASHELRTPLTAIIGEADVSLSKLRSPEEYIETIKVILEEAEKLDAKTKALLFLAQTGFDGKVVKLSKVRIDQLLWDVKETVERINPTSSIFLDTSLMPDDPMKLKVDGNEQLLHLAFTNIVSNGCKYSNNKPVHVSLAVSDKKVIVVVKDEGIGIPAKDLSHIYDTFYRASNAKNYEGYGIGLPLTRNIIRLHKGELNVYSQENKGTIVQVKFPAASTDNSVKKTTLINS